MDWFAWLSKTDLDPALVYEFGLEFSRNELEAEDIPHFDHEFLQSMGISIAKHRLEILKVARKDASRPGKPFSGLISRTKRSVGKYLGRLISRDEASTAKDSNGPREGAGIRKHGRDKESKGEKLANNHRRLALSGPLDGKFQHNYLTAAPHRSPKLLSGPLDYGSKSPTSSHEKVILALRSPKFSGPMDGWAASRSPKLSRTGDGRQLVMSRSLKSSRPLERAANRSPRVSASGTVERAGPGPRSSPRVHGNGKFERETMRDGFDEQSLWTKLFHDMKPT